jgi:hypothetical protein
MKVEIKEILEFKENTDYKRLSCDEIAILKDYITNLQEKNKRKYVKIMTEQERIKYAYKCMVKNNPDEAVKQLLLKDKMIINKRRKITKAIEYIEDNKSYTTIEKFVRMNTFEKHDEDILDEEMIKELLDILRGEDNDNN